MKKRILIATLMVLLSVLLFSCGGGGSPGSDSGSTNINIQSVTVTADTTDMDVVQGVCDDEPEPFTKNTGTMTITAAAQIGQVDPFPGAITVCKLSYIQDKDAPVAVSIDPWTIKNPNCVIIDGVSVCTIDIIDIDRKLKFAVAAGFADANGNPIFPQPAPFVYRVHYDCTYQNNSEKTGSLVGDITIFLANFDMCG